jgi:hypothetical protein
MTKQEFGESLRKATDLLSMAFIQSAPLKPKAKAGVLVDAVGEALGLLHHLDREFNGGYPDVSQGETR